MLDKHRKMMWPALVSAGLLSAIGTASLIRPGLDDAEPFHERIRLATRAIPYQIGLWSGEDKQLPPAAIKLLRPNVLFNRAYHNLETGQQVTLLLVQCKDARDLAGHYPPICYPAHGWIEDYARPRDWTVRGLNIQAMEYGFSFARLEDTSRIVVYNFMVLPDGQILRDMQGVRQAADDYTRHFFGAAQVQLIADAIVPDARRGQAFHDLLAANQPLLEALMSGAKE